MFHPTLLECVIAFVLIIVVILRVKAFFFRTYCEVGNHYLVRSCVNCCVVCKRTCCDKHQGNSDELAGGEVACPDHRKQVQSRNDVRFHRR